jgi:acetylglutamate kinase
VWVGNTLAEQLSAGEVRELIAQGVIHGGMVPKVNAALDALTNGVHRVVITDLEGLRRGTGTTVVQ